MTMADFVYATPPFDHPNVDIILCSSNNIHFHVFKLFLSLASPFFKTLFEIPQSAEVNKGQEVKDGLVVILVTENSKTLDALLCFCYPCTLTDDPKLDVLKDVMHVLEAARKYSLVAIEKKACQVISNPKILEAELLQCFVIACRKHLHEETLLAAKYMLMQPLILSWFQEIKTITAANLLSLLSYHQRCGEAVYALWANLSWITSHYGSTEASAWFSSRILYKDYGLCKYNNCGCPRVAISRYVVFNNQPPQWWEDFMEECFMALWDKPCQATIQAAVEKAVQAVKVRNYQTCSPMVTEGMSDFSNLFVRKVEQAVSQVSCTSQQ